jgi:hypothetical protein
MIAQKKLAATQAVTCAPWQIAADALDSEAVRQAVRDIKSGVRRPQAQVAEQQQSMFSAL